NPGEASVDVEAQGMMGPDIANLMGTVTLQDDEEDDCDAEFYGAAGDLAGIAAALSHNGGGAYDVTDAYAEGDMGAVYRQSSVPPMGEGYADSDASANDI
ncbi:hypothetical protein KIPB_014145, partial [Kipferlia bialata]